MPSRRPPRPSIANKLAGALMKRSFQGAKTVICYPFADRLSCMVGMHRQQVIDGFRASRGPGLICRLISFSRVASSTNNGHPSQKDSSSILCKNAGTEHLVSNRGARRDEATGRAASRRTSMSCTPRERAKDSSKIRSRLQTSAAVLSLTKLTFKT